MKKRIILFCLIIGFTMMHMVSFGQQHLENTMSQYFRSRMLWNPGFTGLDGNKIGVLQNRSWLGFEGAPVVTSITGEFNVEPNSSAGGQLVSEMAGVLKRTHGLLNYAHKLKLNQDEQIRIGISLTFSGDRLNTKYVDQGGVLDPLIVTNIEHNVTFDGNVGGVYSNKNLTLGLSLNRINSNFNVKKYGIANLAIGQIGATYDFEIPSEKDLHVKPLSMVTFYRTTKPLIHVGGQVEYKDKINIMAVYQSSGNIKTGAGIRINNLGEANFFYNTNRRMTNVSSQQYELGFWLFLRDKKQYN